MTLAPRMPSAYVSFLPEPMRHDARNRSIVGQHREQFFASTPQGGTALVDRSLRRRHPPSEADMPDHPNRPNHPNEETNEKQSSRGHGGEEGSARQSGGSQ